MEAQPRQLHTLEKIVALFALFAVLALTIGFAQGAGPKKKTRVDEYDRRQAAHPERVFLRSSSVLVQDAASGETILSKNAEAILPIASITKLMTAMVVLDRGLELEDRVVISSEDMDQLKGTHSRLRPGAALSRNDLLLLALMASENRAAAALARTFPGGTQVFVTAMNEKARALGMQNSHFEDSTGLTSANVSTAPDLARLVQAAHEYPAIRQYSTRDRAEVSVLGQSLQYQNTNGLVRGHTWDIGLSKTGFINEAGRCLVMRVRLASKDLVVILLDSWGKNSRIGDAQRIKKWLETAAVPHHRGSGRRIAGKVGLMTGKGTVTFHGTVVAPDNFLEDVVAGLALARKALPPKYFYDARGSDLFEEICALPEYYPTRAEIALTLENLEDIALFAGAGCELVEYGSGASTKTRILIERLRPAAYVPVDISESALRGAAGQLAREFPWLNIRAVTGDFGRPLAIPAFGGSGRKVVYFPGSTIGNLTREEALAFLHMTRGQVGPGGAMLVGVDVKKDPNILHAAYNDSQGVTARFNLNLLARINAELGADFVPARFVHYAFYNAPMGRIEMHLASLERQAVNVGSYRFRFAAGESIHTENSCKYAVEEFQALAAQAGFRSEKVWTDKARLFSLHGLVGV